MNTRNLQKMRRKRRNAVALFKANLLGLIIFLKAYSIGIVIVLLYLAGLLSPYRLPDLLGDPKAKTIITVLVTMTGALASILGVVVAILLVTFEVLRKKYASYAFKEFFHLGEFRSLFVLYTFTILFTVGVTLSIEKQLLSSNLNLLYISIVLFVICMLVLYPYSKKILSSMKSRSEIARIISGISNRTISGRRRYFPKEYFSDYMQRLEEDPIFILSEIAIRAIKDDDRITPRLILVETTKKWLDLIVYSSDKRATINSLLPLLRDCTKHATQKRQEGILLTVLDAIRMTHLFCAEKRLPYHELIEFDETWEIILKEMLEADLDHVIEEGLRDIASVLLKHLKNNIPHESETWILHKNYERPVDHDKSLQWEHISRNYIDLLYRTTEKAIGLKKFSIASSAIFQLRHIVSEIIRSNLGDLQKTSILQNSCFCTESLILQCYDAGLHGRLFTMSTYGTLIIKDALSKKAKFSKIPLIYFCETLLQLASKGALDDLILNDLGSVGRGLVDKITDSVLHKEALVFICKVFDKIREKLEKDNSAEGKVIYYELFDQLNSIKKWMKDKGKYDSSIQEEISNTLRKFKQIKEAKEVKESSIINWPNLQ